jgi:hypothetical protein
VVLVSEVLFLLIVSYRISHNEASGVLNAVPNSGCGHGGR